MLKSLFTALAISVALPMSAFAADSYTLDSYHTFPHFSINHLGFSTLQGRFDKTSGTVTLDRAAKTGSVNISIETGSVSTGYVKRDEHLKSPDFFNAAEFPAITYKSTAVHFKGDTTRQRGRQPDHYGCHQAGHIDDRRIQLRHQSDEQER